MTGTVFLEIAQTTSMGLSEIFTRVIPSILILRVLYSIFHGIDYGPQEDRRERCLRNLVMRRHNLIAIIGIVHFRELPTLIKVRV